MDVVFILFLIQVGVPRSYFSNVDANELNSEKVQDSSDFGHVYRQGYGHSKQTRYGDIDKELRELDRIEPKDVNEVKDFLQKGDPNLQWTGKEPPLRFLSPRDELSYYKEIKNVTGEKQNVLGKGGYVKTLIRPTGFDFSTMLARNLANPFANRRNVGFKIQENTKPPKKAMPKKIQNVSDYFEDNAFFLKFNNGNRTKLNWTTCDEFSKKAAFHPDDIVNTKWIPFFIWAKRKVARAIVHIFSYPTKKTVQNFKTTYGRHIENINWNRPKLLLNAKKQILLIARDNTGLFYGIPEQELSKNVIENNVTLPIISLRLKIHDPYLAMMYCGEVYAVIFAELGTEPTTDREAILEASTLQFRGLGTPVFRDIKAEKFAEKLERNRKMEAESKKFLKVPRFGGDLEKVMTY